MSFSVQVLYSMEFNRTRPLNWPSRAVSLRQETAFQVVVGALLRSTILFPFCGNLFWSLFSWCGLQLFRMLGNSSRNGTCCFMARLQTAKHSSSNLQVLKHCPAENIDSQTKQVQLNQCVFWFPSGNMVVSPSNHHTKSAASQNIP